MRTLYPPYRQTGILDVTQEFNNPQPDGKRHKGVDFAIPNGYGTFLVAPEDVTVVAIVDRKTIDGTFESLKNGYGIRMRSKANPAITYLYWHCLPVFPVNVGQEVWGGYIVAQMGNSGLVYEDGKYVPLSDRTKTKKGTHLHYEMHNSVDEEGIYLDCLDYIDFTKQVTLNIVQATQQIIQKMFNIIKNRN